LINATTVASSGYYRHHPNGLFWCWTGAMQDVDFGEFLFPEGG
jgi:hypothetical protein